MENYHVDGSSSVFGGLDFGSIIDVAQKVSGPICLVVMLVSFILLCYLVYRVRQIPVPEKPKEEKEGETKTETETFSPNPTQFARAWKLPMSGSEALSVGRLNEHALQQYALKN